MEEPIDLLDDENDRPIELVVDISETQSNAERVAGDMMNENVNQEALYSEPNVEQTTESSHMDDNQDEVYTETEMMHKVTMISVFRSCESENTAHSTKSTNSETSEAVKALEECYHDLNEALDVHMEIDNKEMTLSTESSLDVHTPVVSNNSEGNEYVHASPLSTVITNTTISPSQVMDFDENAQYKVVETTQPEDHDMAKQPEFEGIEFTNTVKMYHPGINEDSVKSSEEENNVNNLFSNDLLNTSITVDSNDEALIKLNDELSAGSSAPLAYEDRSETSDNSLMTFPDKIVATYSVNGDTSSDADVMNKDDAIDSASKLEDSNDALLRRTSTPEVNADSSSNLEPVEEKQPVTDPTPSTSAGLTIPAENLFEYQWPQQSDGEWYLLQEQICEFLHVKSFKRKYPELNRRIPAQEEKEFLKMRGVITETQSDLGLTALRADEVHELMMKDYPDKYKEYAHVLHEEEKQNFKEKLKSYSAPKLDKVKFAAFLKKAVKSAAEFNSQFQRERREERRAYLDLQTMAIHYPSSKRRVLPPEFTKPGPYPVSLIPGQFQDYFKTYSPDELKYLPINTALFGPPKTFSIQQTIAMSAKAGQSDESANSNDEGTQTMSDGEVETPTVIQAKDGPVKSLDKSKQEDFKCRVCEAKDDLNGVKIASVCKAGKSTEELVKCSECSSHGHPSCLDLTPDMVAIIKTYPWQCMDCKTCVECTDPYDEDKMMFCDRCDRGYHTFCVGLRGLPMGRWECRSCCMKPPRRKKLRKEKRKDKFGTPESDKVR